MARQSCRVQPPTVYCRLERQQGQRQSSWQVKALVEATPTSTPAMIGRARSASRAMEEVGTFTTATTLATFSLA